MGLKTDGLGNYAMIQRVLLAVTRLYKPSYEHVQQGDKLRNGQIESTTGRRSGSADSIYIEIEFNTF